MNLAQRAFSMGEISPSLFGRVNTRLYKEGLRTLRNIIIKQDGGIENRPGTFFMNEVKDSTNQVRLIKYVNDTERYLLELGAGYIRFYKDQARVNISAPSAWANGTAYTAGDLVSQGGVNYYCFSAHTSATGTDKPGVDAGAAARWYALTGTIYEIPTPYAQADLANIQITQVNNVIRFACAGQPRRELTRSSDTRWVMAAPSSGPSVAAPANVSATGGSTGAILYWAVTAVLDGTFEESLVGVYSSTNKVPSASSPTTVTFDGVQGAISYNIYRSEDGQSYGFVGSVGGVPTATSDNSWTDTNEVASTPVNTTTDSAGFLTNPLTIVPPAKPADGNFTVHFKGTLSATGTTLNQPRPYTTGQVNLWYQRNTDAAKQLYAAGVPIDILYGDGTKVGSYSAVINVPDDGYTAVTIYVQARCIGPGNGAGGPWSFTIDTSAAPDDNISWFIPPSGFVDKGYIPSMAVRPPRSLTDFAIVADYPAVIGHFQQRSVYANTQGGPNKVYASKTGSPRNFAYSTPLVASDPVVFQLDTKQSSKIKHVLDLGKLVIFTTSGELVAEGDDSGILKPDAVNIRQHSYHGASSVPPVVVGNDAVFVQARGSFIRILRADDPQSTQNMNLSVFASHLFRGKTIVAIDYASIPDSIVWCVQSDGKLLGMTYIKEAQQWGWHRHDTDGSFEDVCVLPNSYNGVEEDMVFFAVKRTISGQTKRYIEFVPPRYFDPTNTAAGPTTLSLRNLPFSDCAKLMNDGGGGYGGGGGGTITTLDHLNGKAISIRGDQFLDGINQDSTVASPNNPAYTTYTVAGGSIAYPPTLSGSNGNYARFGLPYTCDAETLDIETDESSLRHAKILVTRVAVLLSNTKKLNIGDPTLVANDHSIVGMQGLDTVLDAKDDTFKWGENRIGARTMVPTTKWSRHGRMLLRQVDPEPLSILMVSPQINNTEQQ